MRMAYINLFASSHNHDHGFKESDTHFMCLPTTGQGSSHFQVICPSQVSQATPVKHRVRASPHTCTSHGPKLQSLSYRKYFPCLDIEHCLSHSEQVVLLWEFKFLLEGRAQKYLFFVYSNISL